MKLATENTITKLKQCFKTTRRLIPSKKSALLSKPRASNLKQYISKLVSLLSRVVSLKSRTCKSIMTMSYTLGSNREVTLL